MSFRERRRRWMSGISARQPMPSGKRGRTSQGGLGLAVRGLQKFPRAVQRCKQTMITWLARCKTLRRARLSIVSSAWMSWCKNSSRVILESWSRFEREWIKSLKIRKRQRRSSLIIPTAASDRRFMMNTYRPLICRMSRWWIRRPRAWLAFVRRVWFMKKSPILSMY